MDMGDRLQWTSLQLPCRKARPSTMRSRPYLISNSDSGSSFTYIDQQKMAFRGAMCHLYRRGEQKYFLGHCVQ